MRLSQARAGAALAPPLPQPYPQLAARGLYLRAGQSSLWVAAPGVGKSVVLLNLALRMQIPTVYFSGDTDRHDVTMRLLAATSLYPMADVEQFISAKTRGFDPTALLRAADHISFVFDPELTGPYITERLQAFGEMNGRYPALVVVDNLGNAVQSPDDEYGELRRATKAIHKMSRQTGSHFAMLHHATGAYEDGDKPIPQSGAIGKLSKDPEQMVTLYRAGPGKIGFCVTKNRGGPADPSARSSVVVDIDYSRSLLAGYQAAAA